MKYPSGIFKRVGFLSLTEAEEIHNVKGKNSLKVFFRKGYDCVGCGIRGIFFGVDVLCNKHLSTRLYAIDTSGNEILMTQDHIIPKSKGGTDGLNNLQPMCEICNTKKGNLIMEEKNVIL